MRADLGLRPTRDADIHCVVLAEAGTHVRWIPAPRLRGNKLRPVGVLFFGMSAADDSDGRPVATYALPTVRRQERCIITHAKECDPHLGGGRGE